jgi:putative ABC transport system permease protein
LEWTGGPGVYWQPSLEGIIRDFRYSLRILRKDPGASVVAILALALGICASTVVFAIVYNVFVHALPYKDFNRSVVFELRNLTSEGQWKTLKSFSPDEVRAFREGNRVFEDMIAYNGVRALHEDGGVARYWPFGATVTANTFEYLGVPALLGRTITPEDGKSGAPPVFVMNYRFWERGFQRDPNIVGRIFVLDGTPTTLVGIMPREFNAFEASFWLPDSPGPSRHSLRGGAQIIGRLRSGISVQTAAADLDVIAHRLPNIGGIRGTAKEFDVVAQKWLDGLIGGFKDALYALIAAVFLLLLIACANVANLLLTQASNREQELAVRASLGASRSRLIQQLLAESLVIATLAAGMGFVLAYFALKVVTLIPAGTLPDATVIRMNTPVLLLAIGLAVLTAIVSCTAPAIHLMRYSLPSALGSSRSGTGDSFRHGALRSCLVVSEVALSIVLLIGAGLLLRSFFVLTKVDLGFDPKNVLFFRLDLPKTYNTDVPGSRQRKNSLTRDLLESLSSTPGVAAAAECVDPPPLRDEESDVMIPGKPHTERWETRYEAVSEGYFRTIHLPLIRGRLFTEDDTASARNVMVINETFSRQFFPNEDAIGRKVKLRALDRSFLDAPHDTYFEIVGIVQDHKTRNNESRLWEALPEVFIPYSVQGYSWRTFLVRTTVDPNVLWKTIEQQVKVVDPTVSIALTGTLKGSLTDFYRGPEFELAIFIGFAAAGLILVVIGVYSVVAYAVSLRTREIGIRAAMGAQKPDILYLVLARTLYRATAGITIGLLGSYALTRFLASQISGVSVTDTRTFAAVALLVAGVSVAATIIPAHRAISVDPAVALRYE